MLFNSPVFIFAFLPLTFLGFYLISSLGRYLLARAFLVIASLVFYAWWNPWYLPLLLASLAVNYSLSAALRRAATPVARKGWLILGLVFNLGLLGYFKYANFFMESFNALVGTEFAVTKILLPLAISFFTFEQIAYIVDSYKGHTERYNVIDYSLFVVFFPQLIAGPIMHPQEMLPQFQGAAYRFRRDDFSIGLTIFLIGLFKKVLIADTVARYGTPVFDAANSLSQISLLEAWGGALAYTLQLYFDFSGYSDMAIGLGRMFGIRVPLNFNSPYKATNIVDFWRRWHITLSRWLREYLYFSLGGNRKGPVRRYLNLMITMLLGGLWHGAAWTFVFWGGLHGLYLMINHAWRAVLTATGLGRPLQKGWGVFLSRALTFVAVVVGWVYFRADSWTAAHNILRGMIGLNGIVLPAGVAGLVGPLEPVLRSVGATFTGLVAFDSKGFLLIVPLLFVVWFAPNPQQWMARINPTLEPIEKPFRFQWRPHPLISLVLGILLFVVVKGYFVAAPSEFLYFNF